MANSQSEDRLRDQCEGLLSSGLVTEWRNRAYTSESVNSIAASLRQMGSEQLLAKLALAGFTLKPYVDSQDAEEIPQACSTCMYYETHRQFCALPELMLPVKPEWSCRLWRI